MIRCSKPATEPIWTWMEIPQEKSHRTFTPQGMTFEMPKKSLTWGHYHEEGITSFKSYILNTFLPKSETPPAFHEKDWYSACLLAQSCVPWQGGPQLPLYGIWYMKQMTKTPLKKKLMFIIVLAGMLVACIPILRNPRVS